MDNFALLVPEHYDVSLKQKSDHVRFSNELIY